MNQLELDRCDNYYYGESTLTRDSQLYTNSAVQSELSKLMENAVVIVDPARDDLLVPSAEFTFQPLRRVSPPAPTVRVISSLPDDRYVLRKPIAVTVSYEAEEVKAEIPDLELYSFANREKEAIHEVLKDFVDLCDDLLDISDEQLGKFPKRWKNILESMLILDGRENT